MWLRLMMRVVALVEESPVAMIQDPDGLLRKSRIPVFTVEGTVAVIAPAVFGGLLFALLLLVAWVLWPRVIGFHGLVVGGALLVVPGTFLIAGTPELELGIRAVSVVLFGLTPFVYGLVSTSVMGRAVRGRGGGGVDGRGAI
ncbi:MAG TPA: hypothetical protein VNE62_08405 [Actinomycetota bacterium]|nr:hypothetical protein [Actinomycetota bacterium]